jgi:glycosyltransferase involved in cell wall biosynthesis
MSTVAVVMATYNGEKYVAEQIESVLASDFSDFELFIYDDGSRDNTLNIIRDYERQYPEKIHVRQNEVNLGVALNFLGAMARTDTEYIMLCDQDDVWKPDKIAKTLKRMKSMESKYGKELPLAVFTDAEVVDGQLKPISNSFFRFNRLDPRKTDLAHILMENKFIGCTVMINGYVRRLLSSHPLPKQAKFHDWWLALIAASMGKISFINEGTLYYRQHSANVVGGSGFMTYIQNRLANLHMQKEALHKLMLQAEDFLTLYHEFLPEESARLIKTFAGLKSMGVIRRRITILKYGYLKSGLIRNLGLLLIV